MKKLFTLLVLAIALVGMSTSSAGTRKALMEEFTSTTCGTCASLNPAYNAWLISNMENVVPISYNVNDGQPMYSNDFTNARVGTYFSGSYGTPTLIIAGKYHNGLPQSSAFANVLNTVTSQESPISMTVTATRNGNVISGNVIITSTQASTNLKLRVAAMEAYHRYPESIGTNGETNFYFIPRQILPNSAGVAVSLVANETKTIPYSYVIDTDWYSNMMYTAAWLQNDATKEVMQAGQSTMPNLTGIEEQDEVWANLSFKKKYNKIAAADSSVHELTLTNPTNQSAKFELALSSSSIVPTGWTISTSAPTVNVPAKGSAKVNVIVKPNGNPGYSWASISATPIELTSGLPLSNSAMAGIITDNIKYIQWYGAYDPGMAYFINAMKDSPYEKDFAFMPLDSASMVDLVPENFEVGIFTAGNGENLSNPSILSTRIIDAVNNMVAAGKDAYVSSDLTGFAVYRLNAFTGATLTKYKDFYEKTLGLSFGDTLMHIGISGQSAYIHGYNIMGMINDTVSQSYNGSFNNSTNAYNFLTEKWNIPTGSTAIQCFRYADNSVAGIRLEKGEGKIIYTGFSLYSSANAFQTSQMILSAMNWFVGTPIVYNPEITSNISKINFGTIDPGTSKDSSVVISNTGNATLKVTAATISNDAAEVFTIIDFPAGGLTIEPEESAEVKVRFSPKEGKAYTGAGLKLTTNDPDDGNYMITLVGEGSGATPNDPTIVAVTNIDFGVVDALNTTYERSLTIKNIGIQDLVVKKVWKSGDAVFTLANAAITQPLKTDASHTITVKFTPTTEKVYSATVNIWTNDPDTDTLFVNLTGSGIPSGINEDESAFSVFTMNCGPNPVVNNSTITYTVGGNTNRDVKLTLVDMTGRQVALLINGTVAPGSYTMTLDATTVPSGSYMLVARSGDFQTQLPVSIVR